MPTADAYRAAFCPFDVQPRCWWEVVEQKQQQQQQIMQPQPQADEGDEEQPGQSAAAAAEAGPSYAVQLVTNRVSERGLQCSMSIANTPGYKECVPSHPLQ
jgi:hypothetical protein